MLKNIKYKRYCNGRGSIRVKISPDHLADCIEIGHIRKIKFDIIYQIKMVKIKINKHSCFHSPLYDGIYEMSSDIQPLTYEQFSVLIQQASNKFCYKKLGD